jgi:choline dehydrogenase-like flavoprotein
VASQRPHKGEKTDCPLSRAGNDRCWQRGHAADFDAIEELGNPGWGWSSLTPYFKNATSTSKPKSKIQEAHLARLKEEHHGDSGAIKISFTNWYCEAQEVWNRMLKSLGHADAEDGPASGDNNGIWNCPGTVDPATHKRSYAASVSANKCSIELSLTHNLTGLLRSQCRPNQLQSLDRCTGLSH